jgi:hypothetical protein
MIISRALVRLAAFGPVRPLRPLVVPLLGRRLLPGLTFVGLMPDLSWRLALRPDRPRRGHDAIGSEPLLSLVVRGLGWLVPPVLTRLASL